MRSTDRPISFDRLTVLEVEQDHHFFKQRLEVLKQDICTAPPEDTHRSLIQRDDLNNEIESILSPLYLMKETHPDKDVRAACHKTVQEMLSDLNGLKLDEDLYRSLENFGRANVQLDEVSRRFFDKTMDDYLRNGFRLSSEERQRLKILEDQLIELELLFQKNIAEDEREMFFQAEELAGLPEDFLQAHRQDDGRYRITTAYPSYMPVMKFADSEAVRREVYTAYLNRAKGKNGSLLVKIIKLRDERAKLLGFNSHAHIQLEDKMAKTPQKVWEFIRELSQRLPEKAQQDYEMLKTLVQEEEVKSSNRIYLARLYTEKHFKIDEQKLKQYFSLENVLKGLFELCQSLFGIEIKLTPSLPVWHESVHAYEIFENGIYLGRFYLDLFPRSNKYNHAACFGIRPGKSLGDRYQTPESALVCNFTPPTDEQPSLLTHREVETMFHEFGHLLHQQLTTSPLSSFSGTSVARDFVEMPSQIMEHWTWEVESLRRFARHWKTEEVIPEDLLNRLIASRHFNSGIDTQQQLFYGALDMTLHDGWLPKNEAAITAKVAELQKQYTLFEAVPGTCFQAGFGHLMGYSAGYYGYLWSRVFADDMFSRFKGEHLFDAKVGHALRKIVLAAGDTVEADQIVRDFLGREPSIDPFLEGLGLAVSS
jgi:thimet oligopeptidase